MEISQQEWKALARIRQSEDGKALLAVINRHRESARDGLEQAQAPHFSQLQGRASLVRDLVDILNQSPEMSCKE